MEIIVKSDIPPYADWEVQNTACISPLFNYVEYSEQKKPPSQTGTASFQHAQPEYEVSSMPQTLTRKHISRQEKYLHTLNKLRSFMSLPYGWHHGEGVPPGLQTVLKASEIIRFAINKGLLTDAVPSLNSRIQVAIYGDEANKRRYLELTVGDGVSMDLTRYEMTNSRWEITDDRELSTIQEVEAVIKSFGGEIYPWHFTYGYSLKDTITESSNGFQVKLSRISRGAFRSYKNYVYQTPVVQYATT